MVKGPVVLLSVTVVGLLMGLSLIPSLLGLGNVADTACAVCDHRSEAFSTSGLLLPVAASSIAGVLLGSLLFWKPEKQIDITAAALPDRVCTVCGKGIELDWNLCPFCGQSVAPVEAKTTEGEGEN